MKSLEICVLYYVMKTINVYLFYYILLISCLMNLVQKENNPVHLGLGVSTIG